MDVKKDWAGAEEKEGQLVFMYFPLFSLLFVVLLALLDVKGGYRLDEASADIIFWSFFFFFLLLPLALQVAWIKKHYNIAQVLPIFNALGGYSLYYVLGDWLQFLFFIAATILGVWMNILVKKEMEKRG